MRKRSKENQGEKQIWKVTNKERKFKKIVNEEIKMEQ